MSAIATAINGRFVAAAVIVGMLLLSLLGGTTL